MALLVGMVMAGFGLWFETVVSWDLMTRIDWHPVTLTQLFVLNCVVSLFARGSAFVTHVTEPADMMKRLGMWFVMPGLVWVIGMVLLRFWLGAV